MARRLSIAQRAVKRLAGMVGLRAYEAAQADSRFRSGTSIPSGTSANVEVSAGAKTIAEQARDAVRNDAFARRIVDLWAANAVGTGITCVWEDKRHADVWKAWAETRACDEEGKKNLAGIEAAVVRALVQDGEVLVRFMRDMPTMANPLGLRLQVMEADHLDRMKSGQHEGRAVLQGVEVTATGRPVAYWILPRHPGETWPLMPSIGLRTSVRVPADDVLHIYRQERPGQVRGVSWLAPVLPVLRDLKDYEAALLLKAKIEACLSAVVSDDNEQEQVTGGFVTDANGIRIETFEPGMILYRKGAGEIEVINPSGGGSHINFARRSLERAAIGAGLTYDQVSGDLTGANYSSLKAGKIEFRALNGQVQWSLLLPQLCAPIAQEFHRMGAMAGLWSLTEGEFKHTPPSPEMIDPVKDTTALIAQMRAMLLSPQRAAAMMGWEYEDIVKEWAEAQEMMDAAGVVSDADPRRVAKSGSAHDAAQIAAIEIAATGAAIPRQEQPADEAEQTAAE